MLDPLTLDDLMGYGAPPNPQAARVNALRGTPQASPVGRPRVQATSTPTRVQTQAPAPATPAPAGVSPVEGRAAERQRLTAAMDALSGPQDYSAQKAEAIDRSRQSGNALLLSLAAKAAGEDFADAGGMHLKQAMALRDPLKVEGGHVNAQGEVVIDPRFQAQQELARLQRRIGELDKLDAADLDREQRAALAREKMQADAQYRQMMAMIAQGNLEARREATAARNAATPKYTEGERTSQGYLSRMRAAEALLDENPSSGQMGWKEWLVGGIPKVGSVAASAFARDPERQRAYQAQEDWVRAKLRKESGAVIGEQEMAREIATYFPMPGDSPELVAQKRESRKWAERQLEISGAVNEKGDLTGADRPASPGAGPRKSAPGAAPVNDRTRKYYD